MCERECVLEGCLECLWNDMTYTWPAVIVSGVLGLILLELLRVWLVGLAIWWFMGSRTFNNDGCV